MHYLSPQKYACTCIIYALKLEFYFKWVQDKGAAPTPEYTLGGRQPRCVRETRYQQVS